jgi:tetratricopeptide (TPR) repeat protein
MIPLSRFRKLSPRPSRRLAVPLALLTTLGIGLACLTPSHSVLTAQEAASGKGPKPAQPANRERFDMKVRDDFFAGFTGDKARFERGMKTCEAALAKNPKDAPAMVWHGCGLFYQSGMLFQKGDTQKGMELYTQGLKEMDGAVKLEPDNIAVLIPRAASLIPASRYIPDKPTAKSLCERAAADYEKTYALQKPGFKKLSLHSRGELLFGLAEVEARLGREDQARTYLQQAATSCKGSDYEKEAKTWLDRKSLTKDTPMHTCIGCHTK